MEISNLNSEELKQLQMLLNKMNPTEKVYLDPVNKMIDEIMDEFNFAKVQNAMDHLNWKWRGEYVTMEMLRAEAERLLKGVVDLRLREFKNEPWNEPIHYITGGLQAAAWCDEAKTKIIGLELQFVLAEWSSEIKD